MPSVPNPSASRRPRVVALLFVLAANLSCGAEGTPAPEPLDESAAPSSCPSPRTLMPRLYALVDDPSRPLAGLRTAMERASSGAAAPDNAVGGLVANVVGGLRGFAGDPAELGAGACLASEPMSGPEPLALCRVEALSEQACQSRLCATKRGLNVALREGGGRVLTAGLSPILVKVFGYWSNHGRGADGVAEHLGTLDVLQRAARRENASVCAPDDLLGLLDGLVVQLRPVPGCGVDCRDQRFRTVLRRIAADPQLQGFFGQYEASTGTDDAGRSGLAKLAGILIGSLSQMGAGEDAFPSVQLLLGQLGDFLSGRPEYAELASSLEELEPILRELFDAPAAGLPFQERLKGLSRCLVQVDRANVVAGDFVALLGRPGGEGGLDLMEVVDLLDDVAEADPQGQMASMAHAVLASTCGSEPSVHGVRMFMRHFLGAENGRSALPSLQRMLDAGVLDELLALLDHLVHGCPAAGSSL
jgi:hypothetical protein